MCTCRHVRPSRKRDRRLHRQYGHRNRSSPPLMRGVDPARACNEVAFSFSSMRIYVDALGGSGEHASLQRPTWLKGLSSHQPAIGGFFLRETTVFPAPQSGDQKTR
ncbi:Hypothetical protein NTJ_05314 [Nesidiocoris tenuis]|uniref:Uncharacterized protein n=1 Tax=Nesidiocoris tenuis TaxID=355587 RepID=A0ABN7ANM4_9HEMI|nr:Hypothetical protein NTJ_05314 [Nesidiocoris tenuis]